MDADVTVGSGETMMAVDLGPEVSNEVRGTYVDAYESRTRFRLFKDDEDLETKRKMLAERFPDISFLEVIMKVRIEFLVSWAKEPFKPAADTPFPTAEEFVTFAEKISKMHVRLDPFLIEDDCDFVSEYMLQPRGYPIELIDYHRAAFADWKRLLSTLRPKTYFAVAPVRPSLIDFTSITEDASKAAKTAGTKVAVNISAVDRLLWDLGPLAHGDKAVYDSLPEAVRDEYTFNAWHRTMRSVGFVMAPTGDDDAEALTVYDVVLDKSKIDLADPELIAAVRAQDQKHNQVAGPAAAQ